RSAVPASARSRRPIRVETPTVRPSRRASFTFTALPSQAQSPRATSYRSTIVTPPVELPQTPGRAAKLRRTVPSRTLSTRSASDWACAGAAARPRSAATRGVATRGGKRRRLAIRDHLQQELRGAGVLRLADPEDRLFAQLAGRV